MLPFEDARARILRSAPTLGTERVSVRDAAGRVLAVDLVADVPLPRFDYSAMDGYAIAVDDLAGDGPWRLVVDGVSAAGRRAAPLVAGSASRIFTGAPLPDRATAVIMQEHVQLAEGAIVFVARPRVGDHIRRAGEDAKTGAVLLPRGTRLGAGPIALVSMLGRRELEVARRPRVTILCTGDELRSEGVSADDATIPESNSAPLAVLAERAGASVRVAPIARDDADATVVAIRQALDGTDLLLTVGGVSVGDLDVVRPALERAGVTLEFWRVAIKPGKPLAVGHTASARVLGLPGNPSSAIVTFCLFGMPLLRAMQGDARPVATPLVARLTVGRERSRDRLELARVTLDAHDEEICATILTNQASGAATSLALADGLAFIPMGDGAIEAGAKVRVTRWTDF
jgi:molybdopterin molybdotransferase